MKEGMHDVILPVAKHETHHVVPTVTWHAAYHVKPGEAKQERACLSF
jgi:hypothetical protein